MSALNQPQTEQWSSKLAFILAAVGSSVGLGNLWRFSAEAGSNGGGAFIAVYLICVFLIGIPAIMSEFIIGRAGSASSVLNSNRELAERSSVSKRWGIGAFLGMLNSFLILSFYCVVAAWVMAYIPKFLLGTFDGQSASQIAGQFDQLIASPQSLYLWFFIFAGLTIWLVGRGLNRGLEIASKVLMPSFFFLLIALSIFSLISGWSSGGTAKALNYMFSPDLSKITGKVAVSAMGQAFFSIGIGMAMMIAYANYLPKSVSLAKSAVIIGLSDTSVALIAGMAIFPIVFQYGLDFQAGAGLFFQTLPIALLATPGGNLIGAAFFFMAFFAALTTALALLEPTAEHVAERFQLSKPKAALYSGLVMIVLGFGSLYSVEFLDFLDQGLTGPILLPLAGLVVVIFIGWRLDQKIALNELNEDDMKLGKFLLFLTKYVSPVLITLVLLGGIQSRYFPTLFS